MIDIGELTPCSEIGSDISLLNEDGECFDGSDSERTISLVLGWPGRSSVPSPRWWRLRSRCAAVGGRPL